MGTSDRPAAERASPARPAIEPLKRDFEVCFHSDDQLNTIKEATLEILDTVGVRFPSDKALSALADHGARVDAKTQIVTFPPDLVLEAMARPPRFFTLAASDPACDLPLTRNVTFCTTDGCGTEVIDWRSRERRPSTKADLGHVTRLTDYLPIVAFWWPTVGAGDCGETAQLHELDAGWNNTAKHLQGMVMGEREARYAVEMATVVAGSAEELRRRPVMSDLIGVISPLVQDAAGIEASLVFAEAGIPVVFCSMPTLGTTAPATLAGAYAMACAELVSATVIVELVVPGAPVAHSIFQSHTDPRTGSFLSYPLDCRCRFLATELAHHWGVPCLAGYGATESGPGATWQVGVETMTDNSLFGLEGAEMATGPGLTNMFSLFVPEQMMLDADVYERTRYALLDIELGDEELAIETVRAVGPGGHFLGQKHTRRHMRTATKPAITQQLGEDGRYRDPVAVARERAEDILANHWPQPLERAEQAELARILAVADRELRA